MTRPFCPVTRLTVADAPGPVCLSTLVSASWMMR